jgi:hypothetical protein
MHAGGGILAAPGGKRKSESGVGERLAEAGFVLEFAYFEDFAAIEAFDILRIVVFGDELSALVLAGRNGC